MELSAYLGDTDRIVSFRPAVARMLDVVNDPDADFAQVAEALSTDPGVTARVLRWANSPLFGCPNRIETVGHAVAMIGLDAVRQIAVASAVAGHFAELVDHPDDHQRFWSRAVATGHFARLLAQREGNPRHNRLFTAGLLADVGALVLCIQARPTYLDLIEQAQRDGVGLMRLERKTFGFTRVDLTAALLQGWGLPPFFAAVVVRAFGDDADAPHRSGPGAEDAAASGVARPEAGRTRHTHSGVDDPDAETLRLGSELAERLLDQPAREPRESSAIARNDLDAETLETLLRRVDEALEEQLGALLGPTRGRRA